MLIWRLSYICAWTYVVRILKRIWITIYRRSVNIWCIGERNSRNCCRICNIVIAWGGGDHSRSVNASNPTDIVSLQACEARVICWIHNGRRRGSLVIQSQGMPDFMQCNHSNVDTAGIAGPVFSAVEVHVTRVRMCISGRWRKICVCKNPVWTIESMSRDADIACGTWRIKGSSTVGHLLKVDISNHLPGSKCVLNFSEETTTKTGQRADRYTVSIPFTTKADPASHKTISDGA